MGGIYCGFFSDLPGRQRRQDMEERESRKKRKGRKGKRDAFGLLDEILSHYRYK